MNAFSLFIQESATGIGDHSKVVVRRMVTIKATLTMRRCRYD